MIKQSLAYNQQSTLRYGFTLVELLVVIAIIGVLATIAFVAFQSNIGTADNTKKITDLNVVSKAMGIYYVNNKKYPPSGTTSSRPRQCKAGTASLQSAVAPYIDGRADVDWANIIYGVDSFTDPQVYILGVKGLTKDAGQLDDDIDVGDMLEGGNIVNSSSPSVGSSDEWRCDCGHPSADSIYCESNKT